MFLFCSSCLAVVFSGSSREDRIATGESAERRAGTRGSVLLRPCREDRYQTRSSGRAISHKATPPGQGWPPSFSGLKSDHFPYGSETAHRPAADRRPVGSSPAHDAGKTATTGLARLAGLCCRSTTRLVRVSYRSPAKLAPSFSERPQHDRFRIHFSTRGASS